MFFEPPRPGHLGVIRRLIEMTGQDVNHSAPWLLVAVLGPWRHISSIRHVGNQLNAGDAVGAVRAVLSGWASASIWFYVRSAHSELGSTSEV